MRGALTKLDHVLFDFLNRLILLIHSKKVDGKLKVDGCLKSEEVVVTCMSDESRVNE